MGISDAILGTPLIQGWNLWLRGFPGTGGRIKVEPEDFQVEEIPAYEPAGDGEFTYVWVRKRDISAGQIRHILAKVTGVTPREVGMAGLKDRRAITWQWFSLPTKANPAQQGLCGDGWVVVRASKHRNKLRPGHLHGNRFRLVVRNANPDWHQNLTALVEFIRARGIPNAYGSQRFGRDRQTLKLGMALLEDPKLPVNPWLRKLAISATQSLVFNTWLNRRISAESLRKVLAGEILAHSPRGGLFVARDIEREQTRLDTNQIVPAGPLPGSRLLPAQGGAGKTEQALFEEFGFGQIPDSRLGRLLPGTRRRALIYPADLEFEPTPEAAGFTLRFSLPEGSYATVLAGMLMDGENWKGPEVEAGEVVDEAGEEGLTETDPGFNTVESGPGESPDGVTG